MEHLAPHRPLQPIGLESQTDHIRGCRAVYCLPQMFFKKFSKQKQLILPKCMQKMFLKLFTAQVPNVPRSTNLPYNAVCLCRHFLGSFNNYTSNSGVSGSSGLSGVDISLSLYSPAGHRCFLILQYKCNTITSNLENVKGLLYKIMKIWPIIFFSFLLCFPMYSAKVVHVTSLPKQAY